MRIIEPHQLNTHNKSRRVKKAFWRTWLVFMAGLIIATIGLGVWSYKLPVPKVSAKVVTVQSPASEVKISWPKYGQSAVGAVGYGLLESSPNQKAAPTASVAKVMTALSVLRVKPLTTDQDGPLIKIAETDEQLYNEYVAKDGSVVPVKAGELISEKDALRAMLLPSANNMADTLARWAFGNMQGYTSYANTLAKQLGLDSLTITSASGFAPDTVSSAADLVKLGIIALNNPVITEIVNQKSATIPVAGRINNVNYALGHHGIVGIKTGNTDQAGGCYLFAANHKYSTGQTVTVVGAIMGAPVLSTAIQDSIGLINSVTANFTSRRLVSQGDKLGYYDLPWGGQVTASAEKDVRVWGWKGSEIRASVNLEDIATTTKFGSVVGSVQNGNQTANVLLSSDIAQPSRSWRLKRWF